MSFLVQCLFYIINQLFNILSGESLSLNLGTPGKLVFVFLSLIMMALGFVSISKVKNKKIRYLDIPLIYFSTAFDIIWETYGPTHPLLEIFPALIGLVPSIFFTIRCVMWFVDVVKKRRTPNKKNAFVLISYILATIALMSLAFIDFKASDYDPTEKEIQLLDECYDYTQDYLYALPSDKTELQKIADTTENIIENNVFDKAFEESKFYENTELGFFKGMAKIKQALKENAYAEVVALHLKTLIVLNKNEKYTDFFADNCSYLICPKLSFYYDVWESEKAYPLDNNDFKTVINGYKKILSLCDNDNDRILVLHLICDFYDKYDPSNEAGDKYTEEVLDLYNYDSYFEYYGQTKAIKEQRGYTSKALALDEHLPEPDGCPIPTGD